MSIQNSDQVWDGRFWALAALFASWSKDEGHGVGAVLVNSKRRIVGHGYNGFPRGIADTQERLVDKMRKRELTVHAELNCILNASETVGTVLYVSRFPCHECAKAILQAGIYKVVAPAQDLSVGWAASQATAREMFIEAGVRVVEMPKE